MTTAPALGGAPLSGLSEMRKREADHAAGAPHIHVPVPPALGVGLADLHPRAEVTGVGVSRVDAAEPRHAIRDRSLERRCAGDIADRTGALRFRVGPSDQRSRLFESVL